VQTQVTTTELRVLIDGGSCLGRMIMADNNLAAILVPIGPAEPGHDPISGWYLEAGFGPCSTLRVLAPDFFESEAAALAWVTSHLT
jgi:hypothetical protein